MRGCVLCINLRYSLVLTVASFLDPFLLSISRSAHGARPRDRAPVRFLLRDTPEARFIGSLVVARWLPKSVHAAREAARVVLATRFAPQLSEDRRRLQTVPVLLESFRTFCSCMRQRTGEAWTLFWSRTRAPFPPPSRSPFLLHFAPSPISFFFFFFFFPYCYCCCNFVVLCRLSIFMSIRFRQNIVTRETR